MVHHCNFIWQVPPSVMGKLLGMMIVRRSKWILQSVTEHEPKSSIKLPLYLSMCMLSIPQSYLHYVVNQLQKYLSIVLAPQTLIAVVLHAQVLLCKEFTCIPNFKVFQNMHPSPSGGAGDTGDTYAFLDLLLLLSLLQLLPHLLP